MIAIAAYGLIVLAGIVAVTVIAATIAPKRRQIVDALFTPQRPVERWRRVHLDADARAPFVGRDRG